MLENFRSKIRLKLDLGCRNSPWKSLFALLNFIVSSNQVYFITERRTNVSLTLYSARRTVGTLRGQLITALQSRCRTKYWRNCDGERLGRD